MKAITHIQNTAPGPPVTMAIATPAMLPTPTLEAVLTQKAWKEVMAWSLPLLPIPSVRRCSISGSILTCTKRVERVKYRPQPTSTTISTYDHSTSLTALTIVLSKSIQEPPVISIKK